MLQRATTAGTPEFSIVVIDYRGTLAPTISASLPPAYRLFYVKGFPDARQIIHNRPIDILLVDPFANPDEDGIHILKTMQREHPSIALILTSNSPALRRLVINLGMRRTQFVNLPLRKEQLLQVVQQLLLLVPPPLPSAHLSAATL